MARILFVAPSSYPLNGPEAFVNAKVIKTLAEAGHELDVVSLKSARRDRYYPPESNDFYFKKVNSINVVRINTGKNLSTVLNHLGCFLKTGYVYKGSDWAYKAITKCEDLISKNKYDYIYTYDYPSEIVGLYLSKKYNLKWVATWNDPYTIEKYPAPYGQGIEGKLPANRRKLIKEIGKTVYRNVFPNSHLRDYMLKYMDNMRPESCIISPHLVLDDCIRPDNAPKGNTLKIIHSGSIGKERDPKNFLIALSNLRKKFTNCPIEITFLGINDRGKPEYIDNLIEKYDLKEIVKFHSPIPYSESLDFIKEYNLCLIIEAPCKEGIFLPSKVADYIQASKPILSLSPAKGVLNDLWNEKIIPYFADITSVTSIEKELELILNDYLSNNLRFYNSAFKIFGKDRLLSGHSSFLNTNFNN